MLLGPSSIHGILESDGLLLTAPLSVPYKVKMKRSDGLREVTTLNTVRYFIS